MNLLIGMPGAVARRNRVSHNLLTANQASGTDTGGNTTGFAVYLSGESAISSSTDEAYNGTKSLKGVFGNDKGNHGFRTNTGTVVQGYDYNFSSYFKGTNGIAYMLRWFDGTNLTSLQSFTATGGWQFIGGNFRATTSTALFYVLVNGTNAHTCYWDALALRRVIP